MLAEDVVQEKEEWYALTHPTSPWHPHSPTAEEHTRPFAASVFSVGGGHSFQCPLPTLTHPAFTEHLLHPGHSARDVETQSWNYLIPDLKEHCGHFQGKVIFSVTQAFTSVSPRSLFLPLVHFYRLCTYINFIKCSHCIITYLYLHLGIPWPNVISARTGFECFFCFPTAQHNAETIAGSQLTMTFLSSIPLLLLASLLRPIWLPLSTYLHTYQLPSSTPYY